MTKSLTPLEGALELAKLGLPVLPLHGVTKNGTRYICDCRDGAKCNSAGKHPILPEWEMSRDPAEIREWAKEHRGCNWGMPCGTRSGIDVVDVDSYAEGDASKLPKRSPVTSSTRRGSHHEFFRTRGEAGGNEVFGPGLGLRAEGQLVVIPGSRHFTGAVYGAERTGWDLLKDLSQLPKLPPPPNGQRRKVVEKDGRIPEGRRHDSLVSLAGTLRHRGIDTEAIFQSLQAIRDEHAEPTGREVSDDELQRIAEWVSAKSADTADWEGDWEEEEQASPDASALVDPTSQKPKRITWLWRDRLAVGQPMMLDGDTGLGKSLVVLDAAARATKGGYMPDRQFASALRDTVFIISTEEDQWLTTVLPRLHAAKASFTGRYGAIRHFAGKLDPVSGQRVMLTLPDDVEYLRQLIRDAKKATGKKFAVFYADPLVAHISEQVNMYNDHQLRRALAPVARVLTEEDAAAIWVRHSRKDNPSGKAIHAGGGSVGLGAAVRTGALVTYDPNDQETVPSKRQRVFASYKNTNGPTPPSLTYRIITRPVMMSDGKTEDYACIEWLGTSELSADELAARDAVANDGKARATQDILRDLLSKGPKRAVEIYDTILNETNVKAASVRYAANKLGVLKAKEKNMRGHWWWALRQDRKELRKLAHSPPMDYDEWPDAKDEGNDR